MQLHSYPLQFSCIGRPIYRRSLSLSLQGGHTLLSRVYRGEPWLGDPGQDFPGIRPKLLQCFSGSDRLRVLVFDAPPKRDRVRLKEELRALYGIGKSALHITDTHAEAVEIARLLLNRNGRHFLNTAQPGKWPETREKVAQLERYVAENDISLDSFAVDTGMVLALYGLRPPGDIDIVSDAPMPAGPVERHADEWREVPPSELVQDPSRHFSFAGLRFASLREVAALKAKRLAGRDREDLLLMAPLLEAEASPPGPPGIGLKLRMTGLRVRRALIRLLMRVGMGRPLRRLYRRIRGRPVA